MWYTMENNKNIAKFCCDSSARYRRLTGDIQLLQSIIKRSITLSKLGHQIYCLAKAFIFTTTM